MGSLRAKTSSKLAAIEVLCLIHFDPSDFERPDLNLERDVSYRTKRWLKKNAVPTKDCVEQQENVVTPRERRKLCVHVFVSGVKVKTDHLLQYLMRKMLTT